MYEDVGYARKTNKEQTELPSQIWKGNMKEYFNENERKNMAEISERKLGFTLAEVLITLGVIGVVAAMTIPTLNIPRRFLRPTSKQARQQMPPRQI